MVVDYRYDAAGTFTDERKAALEDAVTLWESAIADEFDDVPAGTELFSRDPSLITESAMYLTLDYDIDDIVLLAGFGPIDGPSGFLARAGAAFGGDISDPVLYYLLEDRYFGDPHQPWLGSLGFDESEEWFFDSTPETDDDIPIYGDDFLTVALHEIGHVLGIGASPLWEELIVDGAFTGPRAVALYGGPVPVYEDNSHLDLGVTSDGAECLMGPSTTAGTRKLPTALDLAVLEDLGYHLRTE
jgi:hypothetical protein